MAVSLDGTEINNSPAAGGLNKAKRKEPRVLPVGIYRENTVPYFLKKE